MQRIAVLVDAGYLIARGAEALTGTAGVGRRAVILDEPKVIEALIAFAEAKSKSPAGILRVYWYDATGIQASAEQLRLAELDNVKLRLGTINSVGEQKGVDSLIIADMIELSRNGAVADMLLVAGDEDLRIGVQIAQSYGARVHLLGIEIDGRYAQSQSLMREADTKSGWTVDDLGGFLSRRPDVLIDHDTFHGPVASSVFGRTLLASNPTAFVTVDEAVHLFFDALAQADIDDIKIVWDTGRNIPPSHDGRLLASTARAVGRQLSVEERRDMRNLFVQLLEESGWKSVSATTNEAPQP